MSTNRLTGTPNSHAIIYPAIALPCRGCIFITRALFVLKKLPTLLPAQWYHNLIVVPLLVYFVVSTLPILIRTEEMPGPLIAFACVIV